MFDVLAHAGDLALALTIVATFIAVVRRLGGDGPTLVDLVAQALRPSFEMGWPRGVQEDEPVRWNVERFHASATPSTEASKQDSDDCRVPRGSLGRDGRRILRPSL